MKVYVLCDGGCCNNDNRYTAIFATKEATQSYFKKEILNKYRGYEEDLTDWDLDGKYCSYGIQEEEVKEDVN